MGTQLQERAELKSFRDAAFKLKLQALRQTNNWTNLLYLARIYLYFALVIGATIWFYREQASAGISWWWNVPVTLVAVILIGAGQHQLTGLTHEASHHTLLRNRLLNDLVSDWFCMFPLFSSTYQYRLQHLAHHQFVNDPIRDPDIAQLEHSGHWLSFPLGKSEFLHELRKQLWLPNLVRYMRIRAKYSAVPAVDNPYRHREWKPSRVTVRVGIGYLTSLIALLGVMVWQENRLGIAVASVGCWLGIVAFYLFLPERFYQKNRVHPVIPARVTTASRMTFATVLFTGLAWATLELDRYAALYWLLLWIVPIFTSFSFFMILRQLVQHGNGGRGWLTNTRIFFVNWAIDFSVFPIGQGYHLPHHLFATVPHFRLKHLHQLLLEYPEYREEAVVVKGYFLPPEKPALFPTVLDVLGPEYAPPQDVEAHLDHSVLEGEKVEELQEILREGERSAPRLSS